MAHKQALHIPADVTLPIRELTVNGLYDYQRAVGGNIEVVEADQDGLSIYLNEVGRLDGLPENVRASALASHLRHPLVGDVLVLGPLDRDGDDTDVTSQMKQSALARIDAR